ncbi:MAG: NAD(P)/FAD-dependent oxidoreductase [Defluviitaleaceae bacterium]|nr:NAD(P)/FAD-dependent oxidoreductase [Defluviitaleaceae bacterium]
MCDVIIIGGGIVGTATARALSRYKLKTLLVEQASDIGVGATKANSGILHAGYDCTPGTQKAALNIEGLAMYAQLAKDLDIPYKVNGSLVISIDEDGPAQLQALYERGIANGVTNMELLTAEETLALEPNLNPNITGSLRARAAGIISPYEAAIAFAENAAENGVEFFLETTVTNIEATQNGSYIVRTRNVNATNPCNANPASNICKPLQSRVIINAAGLESAKIHNYVSPRKEKIIPQRGQYILLDNTLRDLVKHTVFQLPTHLGKGVLVVPTVDGNIMLGPTAEPPQDSTTIATTASGLQETLDKALKILKHIPLRERITAFSGIRARHDSRDFIIEEVLPGFVNAMGIDSPGLTAAPAIAERLAAIVTSRLQPTHNTNFNPIRVGIQPFSKLSTSQQAALIKQNPAYGRIICRCETITEAEIIDAIRRPVGARNLNALKRRTRAQMGRCQGGFCLTKLIELLSRELGIPESAVTLGGAGSEIVPLLRSGV